MEYRMNSIEKKEFYKELLSLAIPIGLQNLLIALIGATDAIMLGRLSQDAVASVSLANQIVFIMNLFVFAVVGAGGVLLSQYWGKKDKVMAKNIFCKMSKWTFAITVIFFLLAEFIPELLMRIYTPEENLIEIGASYLRAVAPSYLFVGITQCYQTLMKLEGKAKKSVIISVVALITDVVLDIFLIYGLVNWKGFGANGSAYSTVAVELITLLWCIVESYRGESVHIDKKGLMWRSKEVSRDIIKISIPMLASGLAWGLGFSLHSLIMGHLGSDATAAASITSVAQEIITCVCKGVSAGAGIILGKLLGQDLFDKAKTYGRKFCHISFAVGGIHTVLLLALIPIATTFFILTDTAKEYLVYMLLFNAIYVFAYSINTIIVCGVFPAGGDSKYDATSVILASWCFSLPLSLLGTFVFDLPVMLVYILMCADEIVKLPFIYPHYKKYKWVKNLTREEA